MPGPGTPPAAETPPAGTTPPAAATPPAATPPAAAPAPTAATPPVAGAAAPQDATALAQGNVTKEMWDDPSLDRQTLINGILAQAASSSGQPVTDFI